MATQAVNPSRSRSKSPISSKKAPTSTGPIVDEQGNILPYAGYQAKKEKYCQPSPIPRLAAAASLSKPIPTAGGYFIDFVKEPQVEFPPACLLYEDQPWVLGKLNKAALEVPEPAEPIQLDPDLFAEKSSASALEPAELIQLSEKTSAPVPEPAELIQLSEKSSAPVPEPAEPVQLDSDLLSEKSVPTPEPVEDVEDKVAVAFKNTKEQKEKTVVKQTRTASVSPARPSSKPVRGKSPVPSSPRVSRESRPTTPGKSGDASGKSPRSASKKIVKAKVDLEIV